MKEEQTINGLPKDWKWVRLGEILSVSSGKGIRVNGLKGGDYPVYGGNGLNGYHSEYLIEEPRLIIGRVGVKCGVTHITKVKSWVTDNALIVEPKNNAFDLKFMQLKLQFENLNKLSVSTAQPVISGGKIYAYEIVLPPKEEQQQIVSKIEELFSELDKGIEELKTAQQQLRVYRQAVLKWAFEGKLTNESIKGGELPEGWELKEIKSVCTNIKVGIVIKPTQFYSTSENGVKAFRSANVREFQVNDSDWVYFTEEGNEVNYRTKLKEGDVLLVRSGYPGTSCVVPKKFEGTNAIDILIATPNNEIITSEYLCCFNNSPLGKGLFKSNSRGVAQKHLNVGEYSRLKISVPSIEEQQQIVQEIESRLSVCDKIEETINDSLKQAEALRQSILKEAFEGNLSKNID
jgi:type I restriction enzyme S subunit